MEFSIHNLSPLIQIFTITDHSTEHLEESNDNHKQIQEPAPQKLIYCESG